MRVAIVNDWGSGGGAAFVAERLADGLIGGGHEVRRFYAAGVPDSGERAFDEVVARPGVYAVAERAARKLGLPVRPDTLGAESVRRRLLSAVSEFAPDVISLHNMHGVALPIDTVPQLAAIAPLTWTLHDMWALTGGCYHAGECTGYLCGCEAGLGAECPVPGAHRAWQARRVALESSDRVTFVTPSRWLAETATAALPAGSRVLAIANGIDLEAFKPRPQAEGRERFGLVPAGVHALFCSAWLANENKRLRLLAEKLAAARATGSPVRLVTVGRDLPEWAEGLLGDGLTHLGLLGEDDMPWAYAAADALVSVSLCETAPNTLVEAMACGVPAAAFPNPGVEEGLVDGVTGIIAPADDWAALFRAVESFAGDGRRAERSRRCREVATERYGLAAMTAAYVSAFESMLAEAEVARR